MGNPSARHCCPLTMNTLGLLLATIIPAALSTSVTVVHSSGRHVGSVQPGFDQWNRFRQSAHAHFEPDEHTQKAVPLLVDRDGAQLTDSSAYHHGQPLGQVASGGGAVSNKVDSASVSKRRVLVIGGSGFMGRATVQLLQAEGHQLTVLNRGVTKPEGYEGVTQIKCDRMGDRASFKRILREGKPWDVVIDFIGMHPELTKDVLDELHPNGLRHFIHISTISAYEPNLDGSGSMGAGRDPSVPHVVEEDMFNQRADDALRLKRIKARPYGGNKWQVELFLKSQANFPFTSIRIPECIGPRSDTRHWFYQVWAQSGEPVWLHPQAGRQVFRLQYGNDTARAISSIIKAGPATYGEAFNIAQDEVITMSDYVNAIFAAVGQTGSIEFKKDAPMVGIPSALFGALDTTKAARMLGWKATPMSEFMQRTVDWWSDHPSTKPDRMPDHVWNAYQQKM